MDKRLANKQTSQVTPGGTDKEDIASMPAGELSDQGLDGVAGGANEQERKVVTGHELSHRGAGGKQINSMGTTDGAEHW